MRPSKGPKKAKNTPTKAPKKASTTKVTKRTKTTKPLIKKKTIAPKQTFTVIKRFGSVALDAQGRPLPVDYQNYTHLHDPYDMFYHDTSSVFDTHDHAEAMKVRFPTHDDVVRARITQRQSLLDQLEPLRAKIKDPKELEAFDNVLVAALNPNETVLTEAEVKYQLEKRGFRDFEQVNSAVQSSWHQFWFNDLKYGTTKDKVTYFVNQGLMWGSTFYMAYIGWDAWTQYLYDLEYPLHDH